MIGRLRVVALSALCLACGPTVEREARQDHRPVVIEGVMTVNDVPITAVEVEPLERWIGELFPAYTQPHRRRLALTNVALPRAAIRARQPDEREAALAAANMALAGLGSSSEGERAAFEELHTDVSGHWKILGLDLWGFARELEPGTWGGPLERVGRFTLVRLDEPVERGLVPARQQLTLSILDFPYLDPQHEDSGIEAAIDACELRILDPQWNDVVPERWKYRMR